MCRTCMPYSSPMHKRTQQQYSWHMHLVLARIRATGCVHTSLAPGNQSAGGPVRARIYTFITALRKNMSRPIIVSPKAIKLYTPDPRGKQENKAAGECCVGLNKGRCAQNIANLPHYLYSGFAITSSSMAIN
jgi:hypothetical protein